MLVRSIVYIGDYTGSRSTSELNKVKNCRSSRSIVFGTPTVCHPLLEGSLVANRVVI